ncbi:MAG: flavodoxin family protein [Oscillospiraceae bacterium]|nr:flavodoxin family protein [Oscillospiraceae bacterium]
MTVLVLLGSPHKNGYTAQLLEQCLSALPSSVHVDVINAFEAGIKPCTDCGYCKSKSGCKFNDFDEIDRLLRAADALIIASPIYNLSFPAPLKAVFDRTQQYYNARFSRGIKPVIQKPKKAAMLLTCGSNEEGEAELIRSQLKMMFTIMNTTLTAEAIWRGTDSDRERFKAQTFAQARMAAKLIM